MEIESLFDDLYFYSVMAKASKPTLPFNLWLISGEIGLRIVIPLIVFLLIGIKIDRIFHTTPIFIFIGLGVALVTSSWSIWQMIKTILSQNEK